MKIEKIEELDAWSGMFVMAAGNTRVVRRSAALMEQNQKNYKIFKKTVKQCKKLRHIKKAT